MIDFRYHLVSLISVFLALAVGIVLGAGPLKESIGNSLSEQVESLRADRDGLRKQAAVAEQQAKNEDSFLTAIGPQLVSGQLGGRSVALVVLPKSDSDTVEAVTDMLTAAGATISGRIVLTDDFAAGSGRETLAQELRTKNPALPADDPAHTLAVALAQAVVMPDLAQTGDNGPGRETLDAMSKAKVLTAQPGGDAKDIGLASLVVTVDGDEKPAAPAATTAPSASGGSTGSAAADGEAAEEPYLDLATALKTQSAGTVVAGTEASAQSGLLAALRAEDGTISTVDSLDQGSGPIVTTLALREQLGGGHGDYGFAKGADAVVPKQQTANSTSDVGAKP